MLQFELDEELLSLQDTVHIPGEISIEGENPKSLERILNGKLRTSRHAVIRNALTGSLSYHC